MHSFGRQFCKYPRRYDIRAAMKKLSSLLTALFSLVWLTGAGWLPLAVPSGVQPFTGAGDVVGGAAAWWGLQSYNATTRGTKAVNACNSTGGVDVGCADLLTNSSTGLLVAATVSGITCPGANCTVKIAYDQSGANNCSGSPCDASQATVANRPTLAASCIGSLPCMQCNGTSQILASAAFYGISSANVATGFSNGSGVTFMIGSSLANGTEASEGSPHAIQSVFAGASSVSAVDGTSTTVNAGVASIASAHNICNSVSGGWFLPGSIAEVGVWPIGFNATQIGNMNTNQHSSARWNF